MFVGHFAVALAGKMGRAPRVARHARPRGPAWTDVIWAVLVAAGIEQVAIDPSFQLDPVRAYSFKA